MADHARADERTEPGDAPDALTLWNALVQQQLDAGLGQLTAQEVVDKANPGLWAQAMAAHTAQTRRAKAGR